MWYNGRGNHKGRSQEPWPYRERGRRLHFPLQTRRPKMRGNRKRNEKAHFPGYRILKILQGKGLLESTLESPTRFTAVPFEKVIDLSIKAKRDEAAQMETTKNEILTYWKTIRQPGLEPSLQKFVVIEGNSKIYPKISQMIKDTNSNLSAAATFAGLLRADQFGLFDNILAHPLNSKLEFRFLTDLSSQNTNSVKTFLKKMHKIKISLRNRCPEMGMQLSPRMVIRDRRKPCSSSRPETEHLMVAVTKLASGPTAENWSSPSRASSRRCGETHQT